MEPFDRAMQDMLTRRLLNLIHFFLFYLGHAQDSTNDLLKKKFREVTIQTLQILRPGFDYHVSCVVMKRREESAVDQPYALYGTVTSKSDNDDDGPEIKIFSFRWQNKYRYIIVIVLEKGYYLKLEAQGKTVATFTNDHKLVIKKKSEVLTSAGLITEEVSIEDVAIKQEAGDLGDVAIKQEAEDLGDVAIKQETEDLGDVAIKQETEDLEDVAIKQETEDLEDDDVAEPAAENENLEFMYADEMLAAAKLQEEKLKAEALLIKTATDNLQKRSLKRRTVKFPCRLDAKKKQ